MSDFNTYCKEIKVTGTVSSMVTAAKLLRQEILDILFLDISIGDGTEFDLLEIFPTLKTHIIFIAAHKEFALRAFRYSETDYLLKPNRFCTRSKSSRESEISKIQHESFHRNTKRYHQQSKPITKQDFFEHLGKDPYFYDCRYRPM